MRVTVDTNVLLRTIVDDDEGQAEAAEKLFIEAEVIAIPLVTLAETAWVLTRTFGVARGDLAAAFRSIVETDKVAVDQTAVEDALACLEAGGDFADGLIAHTGRWLGGETFISFDAKAVKALKKLGQDAERLSVV